MSDTAAPTTARSRQAREPAAKPFSCEHPDCKYTAAKKAHLQEHALTHSDERPFVCGTEGCPYAGRTLTALRVHQRAAHRAPGALDCPHCDYKASMPRVLREHIDAHEDRRPHVCGLCGYETSYKGHLNSHVKKCTGEPARRRLRKVVVAREGHEGEGVLATAL